MYGRELTEAEKSDYDKLVAGAKQLNIFGIEEDLDANDYIFEAKTDEE